MVAATAIVGRCDDQRSLAYSFRRTRIAYSPSDSDSRLARLTRTGSEVSQNVCFDMFIAAFMAKKNAAQ